MKKLFLSVAATVAVALCGSALAQAPYPSRPIKMVIPLAAGSAVDNAARVLTQKMAENMGQPIPVENVTGSSGLIGADRLAKAAPDGYTIGGFNDSVLTMVPHIYPKVPWNALRDFDPLSLVGTIEWGIAVKADSPFRTVADLIAAAKANPGKLNFSSGGNGSPQHIGMALFMNSAGIEMTHVPYRGATPAAVGAATGEVDVAMQGLGTITSFVQGGRLRLLAVSTQQRMPQYPDVPTVHESGLRDFYFNSWFAMVVPAKTPRDITERLNSEVRKALADPVVRERLTGIGVTVRGTTPDEMGRALRDQYEMYGKLINEKNIKEQ
ncbi:MAG: tripartite tricarboxylate transporter substrate binding protein [Hydrogenophaga sp.]|jgi:tripartite-type tricarboxylate transporter receptor subunit TctC|nr:tripartite tricarboxylate transporter substrate binding protein [Hydrogenophaga sp.]